MQNYIKVARKKVLYRAKPVAALYLNSGEECIAYRSFLELMVDARSAVNTIRSYMNAVAQYLDFLLVGFYVLGGCTPLNAMTLTRGYYSFLVYGENSSDPSIRAIARLKPRKLVQPRSAGLYHAAIVRFLLAMKYFITSASVYMEASISHIPKIDGFLKSSLALVIDQLMIEVQPHENYNGRKTSRLYLFGHVTLDSYGRRVVTDRDFFPLQHIATLIIVAGQKKQYRNAALWALLAATSLRVSEALQMLMVDIDFKNRQILVISPRERSNPAVAYTGLNEVQIEGLSWKGRRTQLTLLLEPYGHLFFYYVELYIKHDRPKSSGNNFLFQTADGDPLCFSDYGSVILAPFKATATEVLANTRYHDYGFTIHSLRHSYCVYFKNFVQTTGGMGLSDSEIMLLTGHASEESVKVYATAHEVLVREKIALAFVDQDEIGSLSYDELIIGFHERRITSIKQKLAREAEALKASEVGRS